MSFRKEEKLKVDKNKLIDLLDWININKGYKLFESRIVSSTYFDNSDIDIYVEFQNKTFDNLAGLWNYLENLYHKKIDLIHFHKRANNTIMKNIQKEVIYG